MEQIFDKLKSQNLIELNNDLNTLLPDVTTDMSKGQIISFLLDSVNLSKYSIQENTIPIDGSYNDMVIRSMDVLSINFNENINELQSEIYG